VTTRPALVPQFAAIPAFALGLRGWQPLEWSVAAQSANSPPEQGVVVNGEAITVDEMWRRARLLGFSGDLNAAAKNAFERMVRDQSAMQALQDEVISANPGKSRDELIAIIRKRLQKQALESGWRELIARRRGDGKQGDMPP
jgi:hypothetical protein